MDSRSPQSSDNDTDMIGSKRSYAKVDPSMDNGNSSSRERMSDSYVDIDGSDTSYECITPQGSSGNGTIDRSSQIKQITSIIQETSLQQGDDCYICDKNWLTRFQNGEDVESDPWDGSHIQNPVPLPSKAGELLEQWFATGRSEPMIRRVIEIDGVITIEPYRPVIYLRVHDELGLSEFPLTKTVLRPYMNDTVKSLMDPSLMKVEPKTDVKLWRLEHYSEQDDGNSTKEAEKFMSEAEFTMQTKQELVDVDKTLLELKFDPEEYIVVEFKKPYVEPKSPGRVGLANMGNTCYMNSALQCLTHVEELACFFMGMWMG